MNDEIIAEVRAIKDAIGARFNYDFRAMYENIKRGEAELKAAGVRIIEPPSAPADRPGSALQRNRFSRP